MQGKPASIILKNNSINDPQIIDKISEASCAGVRVDMIVRGICCVRAGVPGRTENVHIRSLVGRYLEHSRIYCFGSGEAMRIYIASGDFLTRNTERRVEVGVRVDDPAIAKKLRGILDLQLRDTVNAWRRDVSSYEESDDGLKAAEKNTDGSETQIVFTRKEKPRCLSCNFQKGKISGTFTALLLGGGDSTSVECTLDVNGLGLFTKPEKLLNERLEMLRQTLGA